MELQRQQAMANIRAMQESQGASSNQARAEADRTRAMDLHSQQQSAPLASAAGDWIQGAISGQQAPYSAATIAGMKSERTDAAEAQRRGASRQAAAAYARGGVGRGGGLAAANIGLGTQAAAAKQQGRAQVNAMVHPANFAAQQSAAQQGAPAMIQANVGRFAPEVDTLRASEYQDEGASAPYPMVGGGGITQVSGAAGRGNWWDKSKSSSAPKTYKAPSGKLSTSRSARPTRTPTPKPSAPSRKPFGRKYSAGLTGQAARMMNQNITQAKRQQKAYKSQGLDQKNSMMRKMMRLAV